MQKNQFRPTLTVLEDRCVPATISFGSGILSITGTNGDDTIHVSKNTSNEIVVEGQTFDASQVNRILIVAGAGDDTVTVDANVTNRAEIYGGTGDDFLSGGSGHDLLSGGDGNDVLLGNAGNDYLRTGSGSDLIDGGDGIDTVRSLLTPQEYGGPSGNPFYEYWVVGA